MSTLAGQFVADDPAQPALLAPVRDWKRMLLPSALLLALLLVGILEGWYGRTDKGAVYGSDAVQYLDMSRALSGGDWKLAMNPLWGLGYPLLLTGMRPVFPAGMSGDLLAVRILNVAIFAATWLGFWYLVRGLMLSKAMAAARRNLLLLGLVCLFAATQICIDRVSRVGPDQLVACLFFLTCGFLARLARQGKTSLAVLCGLTMGFGYVTKQAFLPLGIFVLLEMSVLVRRRAMRIAQVALCALVFGAFVILYASGMSAALGRWTLGEAGAINYAWDVNRLAKWVHWEGGTEPAAEAWPKASVARFTGWTAHPPDFGKPIHPTQILGSNPKIYAFGEPFAVTYAPYYNPPWYYEGYRHFVNWRYQAVSLAYNLMQLAQVVFAHPMLYAIAIVIVLLTKGRKDAWNAWFLEQWPVWLFAAASVALFLPVHLEGRYVAPGLAVLAVVPFVGLLLRVPEISSGRCRAILAIFLVGALLEAGVSERYNLRRLTGRFTTDEATEWQAATLLTQARLGAHPRIGVIGWEPNVHCDWAYMAGLRITGEIATAQDWEQFWHLSPAGQTQVLERFRKTGASAVVVWNKPDTATVSGWERLGNLPVWMYRL